MQLLATMRMNGLALSIRVLLLISLGVAIATAERAKSADSFVDIIGVNGHLNYPSSVYMNNYHSIILPRAKELGIRNWRDALTSSDTVAARQREMGSHGIRFNVAMFDLDTNVLLDHLRKVLPVVQAIEGPNELDHGFRNGKPAYPDASTRIYKGLTFPAIVPAIQNDLHSAIKGNADTRHLTVVMAGFSFPDNVLDVGLVEGADCGNTHSYPDGGPPLYRLDDWYIPRARANVGPSKPLIATESGYHNATGTDVGHWISGVSERGAAKYETRLFLEYFNRGFIKVYLYEFIDMVPNPTFAEGAFGLLKSDGTPKVQFRALKNLIGLLKDPGPAIVPGDLGFSLEGDTSRVRHTLLQKRDGLFYLILWLNDVSYAKTSKSDLDPTRNLRIVFKTPLDSITAYHPLESTTPISRSGGAAFLDVKVPDHALILTLRPKDMKPTPVSILKKSARNPGSGKLGKVRLQDQGGRLIDVQGRKAESRGPSK
ncbi:MAG: hypothetical protein M3Y08_09860 [Fibrobacterota bacterium]|nr:hypothetical protein [Fibrobacterota bacterium]